MPQMPSAYTADREMQRAMQRGEFDNFYSIEPIELAPAKSIDELAVATQQALDKLVERLNKQLNYMGRITLDAYTHKR